jgi:hypothetical protein
MTTEPMTNEKAIEVFRQTEFDKRHGITIQHDAMIILDAPPEFAKLDIYRGMIERALQKDGFYFTSCLPFTFGEGEGMGWLNTYQQEEKPWKSWPVDMILLHPDYWHGFERGEFMHPAAQLMLDIAHWEKHDREYIRHNLIRFRDR